MAKTKKLESDVVICGCGSSGLVAGLTARYGGASVIIFEKRPVPGGTSIFVEGMFAVESSMQVRKNIGITRDQAFRNHMDYSHWRANARLVRAFIDKSGSTIDWLQQLGVEFEGPVAIYPGGPHVWHIFKGERTTRGATLINILVAKAKESGVEIFTGRPVKKLFMDKANRIAGVIAEDKNGNTIRTYAKAVIISTGDFANNKEMLEKYTNFGNAVPFGDMKMTGDGIQMAWAVGAAAEGTSVLLGGPMLPSFKPDSHLWAASCQPYLWVNQRGERFCAEDVIYHFPFAVNALANQPNKAMYVVFDEDTKKDMMEKGILFGLGEVFPATTKLIKLDADIKSGVKEGNAFVADTLKELAGEIGVNINGFQATINEYNQCCEKNHDDIFVKNPRYLLFVKKPKFYAVKACVSIMATMGGIKINHSTEVLNENHEVIPGLFAVGNCAGGLYGDSYDVTNTTGGAFGFAINSGRIAGENILKYIGKSIYR